MIILRDYQNDAEDAVRATMGKHKAVLLVLATGAGKTVIFSDIARKAAAKGKRVLILAHRDTLIRQASAKLNDYGVDHGIIMAGFTPALYKGVQVASVQTMVRRLDNLRADFDLIIIDETHLAGAKSYHDIVAAFPMARLLGVTGSPVRLDGRGLGREYGGLFDAMVEGISIRELIAGGYLVRPVVYASAEKVDLSHIKKVAGDYDTHELADVMDAPKITGSAISEWKKVCPGVPAVAWCVNVAHAQHVAAQFNEAGIPAVSLSGDSTSDDRARALQALSNGTIKVITFAMLLVEGVDCPAIGAIIMLRPTMSLASYLQVIGRGLRPIYAPGMPLDTKEQRFAAIEAGPKGGKCFILDHAGLTFKHGFADIEREWTLEGIKKRKGKKKKEEEVPDLKQCPQCYLISPPCDVCPGCGYDFPEKIRRIEHEDGELKEITPEIQEAMLAKQRLAQKSAQAAAKSVEDMMRDLGYSRGRAEAIVKAREEKAALRLSLIDDFRAWQAKTGESPQQLFGVYLSDLKAYKPKALRDLRARFDEHRAQYASDDAGFAAYLKDNLFDNQGGSNKPAF